MRMLYVTLLTLFFLTSCGTNTEKSDTELSGAFISDAKNYYPPKPPGYISENSKGDK